MCLIFQSSEQVDGMPTGKEFVLADVDGPLCVL